jgi:hypothetical protein
MEDLHGFLGDLGFLRGPPGKMMHIFLLLKGKFSWR